MNQTQRKDLKKFIENEDVRKSLRTLLRNYNNANFKKKGGLFADEDVRDSFIILITIFFGSFFFFWNSIILKKFNVHGNFLVLTIILIVLAVLYFLVIKKLAKDY